MKSGELCKACKISVSCGVSIQWRELVGAATHLIHLQKKQTSHKERCQNGSESITTAEQLELPLACQSRDNWGGGEYCKKLREKLTYLYILMHFKWKIILSFLRFCSMSHIILFALLYWICKWSFISCVPHMLLVFDHLYKGHCDEEYASTLWSLVTVCLSGLLWLSNWGPFLPGRARREGAWLLEVEKEGEVRVKDILYLIDLFASHFFKVITFHAYEINFISSSSKCMTYVYRV